MTQTTTHSLFRFTRKALLGAPLALLLSPALAHAAPATAQSCQLVQISATQTVKVCETKTQGARKIMTATGIRTNSQNVPATTQTPTQAQPQQAPQIRQKTRSQWIAHGRAHQA